MRLVVVVLLLVASATCQRDERLFHTRHFWDGFEKGISEAGAEVQRRLDSNLEVAMDHLSDFGKSIGTLSRRIEDQVQEGLPDWLKDRSTTGISPHDAPIEAVEGSLGGDGLDDGLQVYFDGDSEREELPEPHTIPAGPMWILGGEDGPVGEGSDLSDAEMVQPPRTGGPLFDINFNNGFPPQFPFFLNRRPGVMDNPFWWAAPVEPWWKGDNVCLEEEEINEDESVAAAEAQTPPTATIEDNIKTAEESGHRVRVVEEFGSDGSRDGRAFFFGSMEINTCSETRDKYTCTTKIRRRGINRTVRRVYRCCHGYVRETSGCTKVNLVPLADSLEGLGLTDFLSLAKNAGAIELLNTHNLTVFAPSNEAVQDFNTDLTERNDLEITDNEVYRRKRQSGDSEIEKVVFSHLHQGFLYAGDLNDEQVITSMNENSTIRINIYRQTVPPIITANCAKITKANQHSTNGVLHTLDRVMEPATKSIADIISSDPQFSILKKLMSSSEMLPQLRDDGQLTLLAPTDAAFNVLPVEELAQLMKNSACLPSILKNHILPNVICSAAITNAEAKTKNLLNKYLKVKLDDSGKLFVEGAQIVARDMMATNGVIHIIDAPLMPTEAKPVLDVLNDKNLTKFVELLEIAELTKELEAMRDISIFAPSNHAIERLGQEKLDELKNDRPRLQDILRHHITLAPFESTAITHNHLTETKSGHPLRVNLYRGPTLFSLSSLLGPLSSRMRVTAGCGVVTFQDSRACGAALHIVDSLLEPPKQTVMEKLRDNPDFSIFYKIVSKTNLSEELSGDGPFTVLAPSDHVFKTLPEPELKALMEDQEIKNELVKRHILKEHVCCSGITPNMFMFRTLARTVYGDTINLHQTPGGMLKAGSARITKCDKPAKNGIVHTVNSLYVEPHVPYSGPGHRW